MKLVFNLACIMAMSLSLFVAGCSKSGESGGSSADGRCPHEIKEEKCPFCNPALIESDGFCGEHGVAEALCASCRPYLSAAFRAKGDWCGEHSTPDSQCIACHPELKAGLRPGEHGAKSANVPTDGCAHGIAQAKCPFCTPSLIESAGYCNEHAIAEALCVQCRPFLKAAFISKGDWCGEHETPESQCLLCNPDLGKSSNEGGG
jgi:cobalt-zinc-cadmium efflux system membrane fusion protein